MKQKQLKPVRKCDECGRILSRQKMNKSGYCSNCGIRIRNKIRYKKIRMKYIRGGE